jgi:ATP-dependent DNA ligase
MHARLDRGAVKLLTRTGLDWTHKYPAIAEAVSSLDTRQAYLDGELCDVGPDGIFRNMSGYGYLLQLARMAAGSTFVQPDASA